MSPAFRPGQAALVTGRHTFGTRQVLGEFVLVQKVHQYPPGVVEGDVVVEARLVDGTYATGEMALGPTAYFSAAELSAGGG